MIDSITFRSWNNNLNINQLLNSTKPRAQNKVHRNINTTAFTPGGGGDSAYEGGTDARGKFWIKPLKETDLGVAQAFFDP